MAQYALIIFVSELTAVIKFTDDISQKFDGNMAYDLCVLTHISEHLDRDLEIVR